ncbi:MAG: carboxy-S-adenosyl-L-methionine synthase CmoA [Methylococcales bacterium]|nr:carboxy-S-adenosyl-L-methionine synthase CmoA [Methylococcales bacterium]
MSTSTTQDTLYASPIASVNSFKFDESVVNVFPDMIQRSVPGYQAIISAIGLLAERYAQEQSVCYDLGCSLGAATLSMRHHIAVPQCKIVAVDSSEAMIKQLKNKIAADDGAVEVEVVCDDIRDIEINNASVVVLNFTLQFIPIKDRQAFLGKIYQGLLPGGILILSEKLKFDDPRQQALQTDLHHVFKKSQGYSDLEISQKRSALENVLLAETFSTHQQRLSDVGFSSTEVWFQYFNFASMISLK